MNVESLLSDTNNFENLANILSNPIEFVHGRLTVLNGCGIESNKKENGEASSKYKFTISELWRRLNPPENINTSILNGLLRRGKNKDSGVLMHNMLKKYGMDIRFGRRAAPTSSFTLLTEGKN